MDGVVCSADKQITAAHESVQCLAYYVVHVTEAAGGQLCCNHCIVHSAAAAALMPAKLLCCSLACAIRGVTNLSAYC
jgi:hypothetical protein